MDSLGANYPEKIMPEHYSGCPLWEVSTAFQGAVYLEKYYE